MITQDVPQGRYLVTALVVDARDRTLARADTVLAIGVGLDAEL